MKSVSKLNKRHEVQLINYLKATGMKVGLLVNFGKELEFKRKIF
ncbi:GxxExxY protein [Sporohalobacter salinus]